MSQTYRHNRTLKYWFSLIVAVSLATMFFLVRSAAPEAARASDGASHVALTAAVVERAVNADGTERYRFEKTIARRGDGATVVSEHRYYRARDGRPLELRVRHIWDPNSHRRTSIYPGVGGKVTVGLGERAVSSLNTKPPADCIVAGLHTYNPAGGEEILGEATIRRERTLSSSDGRNSGPQEVEWVAPALDCFSLRKELATYDRQGALVGKVVREAISIQRGEPDPALFVVPAGLQEMMPSEIMEAHNRIQDVECSECDRAAGANGDRMYLANRPQLP